jgi:hypothetical protein
MGRITINFQGESYPCGRPSAWERWLKFLIGLVMLVLMGLGIAFLFTSCASRKQISSATDSASVRVETRYRDLVRVDTTYIHDSVLVRLTSDTVYMLRYRTEYRERLRVDTIAVIRSDTVRIDNQQVVKVQPTAAERVKCSLGLSLVWLIALAAIYLGVKAFLRS